MCASGKRAISLGVALARFLALFKPSAISNGFTAPPPPRLEPGAKLARAAPALVISNPVDGPRNVLRRRLSLLAPLASATLLPNYNFKINQRTSWPRKLVSRDETQKRRSPSLQLGRNSRNQLLVILATGPSGDGGRSRANCLAAARGETERARDISSQSTRPDRRQARQIGRPSSHSKAAGRPRVLQTFIMINSGKLERGARPPGQLARRVRRDGGPAPHRLENASGVWRR